MFVLYLEKKDSSNRNNETFSDIRVSWFRKSNQFVKSVFCG